MNQSQEAAQRARAEWIYRWVLRLYPAAHRRAFGEPMRHTFGDYYRDAVQRGGKSPARFWLGVVGDESQSLVREHIAALGEESRSMDKLLSVVWKPVGILVALLLWVAVLDLVLPIPHEPATTAWPFLVWLEATVVYTTLLVLVYRFVYRLPRPEGRASWRSSWWRLGLVLGGILGLDILVLNALDMLAPILPGPVLWLLVDNMWPAWALGLPLLAGAVGVVGGYTSGRLRTGVAAGALAGASMLVIQSVSLVLLMGLSNALPPSVKPPILYGAEPGIRFSAMWLWFTVTHSAGGQSSPLGLLFQGMFIVIVWPVPLIVGSMLGARAARRVQQIPRRELAAATLSGRATRLRTVPVGFTLLLLVLGLAIWSTFTLASGPVIYNNIPVPILLKYLGTTYVVSALLIWLLAGLGILVALYVTMRPNAMRQEANTASAR